MNIADKSQPTPQADHGPDPEPCAYSVLSCCPAFFRSTLASLLARMEIPVESDVHTAYTHVVLHFQIHIGFLQEWE